MLKIKNEYYLDLWKSYKKRMNEHSRLQGKLMKVSKYYSFKDR